MRNFKDCYQALRFYGAGRFEAIRICIRIGRKERARYADKARNLEI